MQPTIKQWQQPGCESGDVVNTARILVRKHMKPIAADTIYHSRNDLRGLRDQILGYRASVLVSKLWRVEDCRLAETGIDVGHVNAGVLQVSSQRYAEST